MKKLLVIIALAFYINANSQNITTIVGNGTGGFNYDGVAATGAELNLPNGVALDAQGNIYIADYNNHRIRKVTTSTGIINTIAGTGTAGYSGDGGSASATKLKFPTGVALDANSNVYIADAGNERIRKIDISTGIITTVAGNGTFGYSGDGGQATAAELGSLNGIAFDAANNLYITDLSYGLIHKVTASTGIITTIAGNGTSGYSGDGGLATTAELVQPYSVAIDATGNVYIADWANNRIRKVDASTGNINTIAGTGTAGYSGDGGGATIAELNSPKSVIVDAAGNIYIADAGNRSIRRVDAGTGIITTVAGNGTSGYSGDDSAATAAQLNGPAGIALDANSNLYIADAGNERIRFICNSGVNLSVNPSAITICIGATTTLTASGADTYTWSNGATSSSITVTPTGSTNYIVTGTSANNCTNPTKAIITVNALPTITTNSVVTCPIPPTTLTASGASTYTWSTGEISSSITSSPTVTTTYTVTGTNINGCQNTASVTVNALPNIVVTSDAICFGSSTSLYASGGYTYLWSDAETSSSIMIAPWATTTYTVIGKDTKGCKNTAISTVTVNPLPTVTVNSPNICASTSATITANGAGTYTWSTGVTNASITATPTTTTHYTVTGIDTNGCKKTVTSTVTVNPLPTISVNSGTTCSGQSFTLSPSGADTYTFSSGNSIVTPTANSSYSVTGTSIEGCLSLNTAISTVSINPLPIISVNSGTICNGQNFTIIPSGANTYTFSSGSAIVNPTVTSSYSVTGTSIAGCLSSNTAISSVSVIAAPTVTAPFVAICIGTTATLTANGANTYTWSNGAIGATITESPTVTTSYTVIGTGANGCPKSAISTVSIIQLPTITAGNITTCVGSTATITASGANTYTWSGGATGTIYTVSPTVTTNYTVMGTDINGCVSSSAATTTVTVNALPIVTASQLGYTPCAGSTVHLTASGANTYTWSGGATGTIYTVSPTVTTNYTVMGTDINGCVSSSAATTTVTVNPLPIVTANTATVCSGTIATLTASGANTYVWSNGETTASMTSTPISTTIYAVAGTDINGCVNSITATITVNSLPTVTVSPTSYTVCPYAPVTFTASGANTYTWSNGTTATGASINVTPAYNSSYQVKGTDTNGCISTSYAYGVVHVYSTNYGIAFSAAQQLYTTPPFVVQFSNTTPNLANMSGYTFTWLFGDGQSQQTNNATVFHQYTYNGTYDVSLIAIDNSIGCADTLFKGGYIFCSGGTNCALTASITAQGSTSACVGDTVFLNSNTGSGYTYQWSLNGIAISGATDSAYGATTQGNYVVAIGNGACSVLSQAKSVSFISAPATPSITTSGNINLCGGGSVYLTATTGYTSYLWSTGATTQNITVTTSGVYTVAVSNGTNGCTSWASYSLNASAVAAPSICIVGVDSATNKNLIVWDKAVSTQIDSFIVYKEGNVSNQYNRIGAQTYSTFSTFIDNASNPAVQADRYELSLKDSCGVETLLSGYHKTIHLSINQGVGNSWNLLWNRYEGFSIPTYNIYRGTSASTMALLTSLAGTNTSYTDLNPPMGIVYYQIEGISQSGCNPSLRTMQNYMGSRSNITNVTTTGINQLAVNNNQVEIYPNPNNGSFIIETNSSEKQSLQIFDVNGKLVLSQSINDKTSIDASRLNTGVYNVSILNSTGVVNKRIVIVR